MQTIACHDVLGRKKRLWGQRSKFTKLKRWKWVEFGVEAWGGGDFEKGLLGDFKNWQFRRDKQLGCLFGGGPESRIFMSA
jgi:hypothetical protein